MDYINIKIDTSNIELEDIINVAVGKKKIKIDNELIDFLQKGRDQLEQRLKENKAIYGINTGFGGNANLLIPFEKLDEHQSNLLEFLSAGTGDYFTDEYVRAIQFIVIIALSKGWSAVRPIVIQKLAEHINKGIIPQVPKYGSVGASGDLVPLSYIANSLCGKGIAKYNGMVMESSVALEQASIEPLVLKAKEGLALVNGTRVMSAVSCLSLYRFEKVYNVALGAVALIVEAMLASIDHYDMRIQMVKNHPGQIMVANVLNTYLQRQSSPSSSSNSFRIQDREDLIEKLKKLNESDKIEVLQQPVQEVYSLRCAPQILGVIFESIEAAKEVLKREIFSANDNPLIDPFNGDALSGGNFMGNHIARTMDGIKLDMTLVANHLHSLVALIMYNGFSRNLPNSLSPNPGVYQGFKGMQISQTSLVLWLRQECAPACIHSLTTEQFNQDIVSLGLHSALGAESMEKKLCDIVSMTLLMACQAIDLRFKMNSDFKLCENTLSLYKSIRKLVPVLEKDRATDCDIKCISNAIRENKLSVLNC